MEATGPFFPIFPEHLNLTVSPDDTSVIDGVALVPTGTSADDVAAFVDADEFTRDVQTSYGAVVAQAVSETVNQELVTEGAATAAAVALIAAKTISEALPDYIPIGDDLIAAISALEAANLDTFSADAEPADPEAIAEELDELVNDKLLATATDTAVAAVLVAGTNTMNRLPSGATASSELTDAIAALEAAETDDLATITSLSEAVWTAAEADADEWGMASSAYDALRSAEEALNQVAAMAVSTSDTGNEAVAVQQAEAVFAAATDVESIAAGDTNTSALASELGAMSDLLGTSRTLLLLQTGSLSTAKLLEMAHAAESAVDELIEEYGIGADSTVDGTNVPGLHSTMLSAIETAELMVAQASDDGNEQAIIETAEDMFNLNAALGANQGFLFEDDDALLIDRIEGLEAATDEAIDVFADSQTKVTLADSGSDATVEGEIVDVSPPPTPVLDDGTTARADDLTEEEAEDLGWIAAVVLLVLLCIFCPLGCCLYARLRYPGKEAVWFKLKTTHSNMQVPFLYMNAEVREAMRKDLRAASDKKEALMAEESMVDAMTDRTETMAGGASRTVDPADVDLEDGKEVRSI